MERRRSGNIWRDQSGKDDGYVAGFEEKFGRLAGVDGSDTNTPEQTSYVTRISYHREYIVY